MASSKFFELTHPSFGILKVQKLTNNAALPKRSTKGAAGYDLCAAQDCTIPASGKGLVKTGLSISFPPGLYARIAPRSGLALKRFIDVGAGVIDADYRGEVGVVLFNHGDHNFEVKMGDRIAQLILERIDTPPVEEVQELDSTVRGSGGFGSTGIQSGNDTGTENIVTCKNERTEKEKGNEKAKNETLKGRIGSRGGQTFPKSTEIRNSVAFCAVFSVFFRPNFSVVAESVSEQLLQRIGGLGGQFWLSKESVSTSGTDCRIPTPIYTKYGLQKVRTSKIDRLYR